MKKKETVITLFVCAVVVVLASAYASSYPDGLEWVAEQLGFASLIRETNLFSTPLADYELRGVSSSFFSTLLAGLLGIGAVFGSTCLINWWLKKGGRTYETMK